jgi:hypothetical protein
MSEHDGGPPGIALEGARVISPGHQAEHDRHREVLAALGRLEALLERLAQAAERQPPARPRGSASRSGK